MSIRPATAASDITVGGPGGLRRHIAGTPGIKPDRYYIDRFVAGDDQPMMTTPRITAAKQHQFRWVYRTTFPSRPSP